MPVMSAQETRKRPIASARPDASHVPDHQLPFMKHAGDLHMGAKEDQVSRTMPPRPDDDEPKQG